VSQPAEFWDGILGASAPAWGRAPSPAVDLLAAQLAPGARVLVPGCGYGRNALALAERGYEVTAYDYSAAGIARAQSHAAHPRVRYLVHDAIAPTTPEPTAPTSANPDPVAAAAALPTDAPSGAPAAAVPADARPADPAILVTATPAAPDSQPYDGVLCHFFLHLFRAPERQLIVAGLRAALAPGGLLLATGLSTRCPFYGNGEELEPDTWSNPGWVPIHFYTPASLAAELAPLTILDAHERDEPEDKPGGRTLTPAVYVLAQQPSASTRPRPE
jgi:SAM-dependent methyltransferase